ncbi:MAG: four helix bundle protein [Candidatus Methylomirabilales bacterium]
MFRFERLVVWQKALDLFDLADQAASKFPAEYRFSVADQLRRAALSVSSNIAEGSGRETPREADHFFTIAKSSTFEVVGGEDAERAEATEPKPVSVRHLARPMSSFRSRFVSALGSRL